MLRRGAVKELLAGRNVIAYGRMLGKYQAVVAVNNNAQERELELPVWQLGITGEVPLARLMLSTEEGYNVGALRYPVRDGMLKLKMPPYSAALFATYADEFFPVVASVEPAEREEEEN